MKRTTTPNLKESDVQKTICDYLRAHGWRIVRTQFAFSPGAMSTGEPGMADVLALYPLRTPHGYATTLATWIEFKHPNSRMTCRCEGKKVCRMHKQERWQQRERSRGFVVWSGVNDFAWFAEQYQAKFGYLHSGEQARGQLDLLAVAQ